MLSHQEFVAQYHAGRLRAVIDRKAAARFVSARMLLPLVLLPVLGLAVGLAMTGSPWSGLAVFLAALGLRALIRATSHGFVLTRVLEEPQFYDAAVASGLLRHAALEPGAQARETKSDAGG